MSRDMYTMAYRLLQQQQEAEDIVQDVLLTLYERRDEFPPEASDKSYVLAMVRNRCIDRLRSPHYESLSPPDESSTTIAEPMVDSPEAQLEAQDYLDHILASLPERTQQIVRLRLVDDLSFDQIAAATGISATNARMIVSRTLRELRKQSQ